MGAGNYLTSLRFASGFFFFYEERKGIMYRMVDKKIAIEEI